MVRPRVWDDLHLEQSCVDGVGQVLQMVSQDVQDITAVRVVGRLFFGPQSISATDQAITRLDIGIGITSVDAFNVGITAIPDVTVGTAFPPRGWLWKTTMYTHKENNTGSIESVYVDSLDIDIRAARKLDRGIMYVTFEANDMSGTAHTTRLAGLLRTLCLI